jgi:hypothetical protein
MRQRVETSANGSQKTLTSVIEFLTTERLLLAVVFVTLALGITGYSGDVFLHLATGKHILMTGALPDGDPFSFTRPGTVWVMHQWLSQAGLYFIYAEFGFTGLKLLGATLLMATLYLNRKSCELLGVGTVVSWGVTLVLFLTWVEFMSVRPHTITYFFFALTLHTLLRYRYLGRSRLLWMIPFIMPIWVNSHGGFLIGIILVGYYLVLHVIELRLRSTQWHMPWLLFIILLAMIAASLLNPYGYKQLLFPFLLMEQWAVGFVTEWQPLDIGSWKGVLYLLTVGLSLVTLVFVTRQERVFRLVLMLPFALAAIQAIRHLPIAALMMGPFLSHQVALLIDYLKTRRARNVSQAMAGVTSVAILERGDLGSLEYYLSWIVLGGMTLALLLAYPAYAAYAERAIRKNYPVDATRYLVEHQIEGRMFTNMEYSTYILFARLPEQKLFYDVRVEMYGDELVRDYITMVYALEGWERLFEKHAIDYAVLDKEKPIYNAIVNWDRFSRIYEDETCAIFVISGQRYN